MTKKEYPLDIALNCAVSLEGGLRKYPDIARALPRGTVAFVHVWNRALMHTVMTREFRGHLGYLGRAIATAHMPELTATVCDKLSVPYRSWYFAYRMAMAYNFVRDNMGDNSHIWDFGSGLSPLPYIINMNLDKEINVIDTPLTHDIFRATAQKMGISYAPRRLDTDYINKTIDYSAAEIHANNDLFVSLGTFCYLPRERQGILLNTVGRKFPHFLVELNIENSDMRDAELVKKLGTEYAEPWKIPDISRVADNVKVQKLKSTQMNDKYTEQLTKTIQSANEAFVSRGR